MPPPVRAAAGASAGASASAVSSGGGFGLGPLRAMKCGVGQLGAAQVDLVVRHRFHEFEDLLPAGDEARAQHVVHAEGLGRRGGRRGGVGSSRSFRISRLPS